MNTRRLFALVVCVSLVAYLGASVAVRAQEAAPEPPPDSTSGSTEVASNASGGLNLDMKLDDLVKQDVMVPGLSTVVNSVERRESTVGRTPAAIFVITQEMIKRSGVRNIPDALRMAPGVDVARINASTWAVSIRGFNSRFANYLLVQIDRRVVYQVTNGNVYWDQQNVILADVERIEVIRGPGTTMWGSNAVNGVINIITKKSSDTQGVLVQSGAGSGIERDFNNVRYGGKVGDDTTYRVYGQQFERDRGWSPGNFVDDSWRWKQIGFRMESTPTKDDLFTLQGDLFIGDVSGYLIEATTTPPFSNNHNAVSPVTGGNLLARYTHTIDDETSWQLQSYYDRYGYNSSFIGERRDTYDVDFQFQFSPATNHQITAGTNYRNSHDHFKNTFAAAYYPPTFTTEWASVWGQDTVTLVDDRWYFTIGTRLEQQTFGGFQVEPTARLLFTPTERQSLWAAVSRAIRNPTRLDRDVNSHYNVVPNAPVFVDYLGNPNFKPVEVMAYELGYRAAPTDDFTWDIAGFVNQYRRAVGRRELPPFIGPDGFIIPIQWTNGTSAFTYGVELAATYKINDRWRLNGAYTVFQDEISTDYPIASPRNQVYMRSSWDFTNDLRFDMIGRYVDALVDNAVPAYVEMDLRLAWQATDHMEVSFVGQNLLQNHHLEFVDSSVTQYTQVPRAWYGMISWSY